VPEKPISALYQWVMARIGEGVKVSAEQLVARVKQTVSKDTNQLRLLTDLLDEADEWKHHYRSLSKQAIDSADCQAQINFDLALLVGEAFEILLNELLEKQPSPEN
jgi:hypothetical protein